MIENEIITQHTVFSEISAHQIQWFFKGGSTWNRWVLMGDFSKGGVHKTDGLLMGDFSKGGVHKTDGVWWALECFLLPLKIKRSGRLFRQYGNVVLLEYFLFTGKIRQFCFQICISTPLFAAVVPFLAVFYVLIQRAFVPSSRQIKRLEAVSRSPILSHFQESLSGRPVILTMNQEGRFVRLNDRLNDVHNMASYANAVGQR